MYVAPAHFERAFSVTAEGKIMSWKQPLRSFSAIWLQRQTAIPAVILEGRGKRPAERAGPR